MPIRAFSSSTTSTGLTAAQEAAIANNTAVSTANEAAALANAVSDALTAAQADANGVEIIANAAVILEMQKQILSPAGAGNVSRYVWEDIAGQRIKCWANPANENLTMLLSVVGSQDHFWLEEHEEGIQWRAEYSHLFREGMKILVDSISGVGSKLFRVKAGATIAQLLKNPTDPTVLAADSAYEPWSFE